MKIDFANLTRAYLLQKDALDKEINKVISSASFIMGKDVYDLESSLAQYVDVKYSISCSSGTDALQIALMALNVGPGDEVITTPFTFISTAEVIALVGAKPVFVDINKKDFNINISKIEDAITPKTKVIMPVSLYGQMPDMKEINLIAKKHNLYVIEDAAQSFGATQKGRKSCSFADISCTSFFPAKPLGCFGDGGAIFTDDDTLSKKMTSIRIHGQTERYHHQYIGLAARMDNLQAAILNVRLKQYDKDIKQRQSLANFYSENITNETLKTPKILEENTSVWAQYTLLADDRLGFQKFLSDKNIPTAIYYPKPLHLQKCFEHLNQGEGCFPVAEAMSKKAISIPMNPYFRADEKTYIIDAIKSY